MSGEDHVDIIGAIADGQGGNGFILEFLLLTNESDYLCLLLWRDSAGDDDTCIICQDQEIIQHLHLLLRLRTLSDLGELVTSDDYGGLSCIPDLLLLGYEFLHLFLNAFAGCSIDDEDLHLVIEDGTAESDIDSSLDLITCEYPEFDASLSYVTDDTSDVVLELVLDSCTADQFQILLDLVSNLVDVSLSFY